MTNETGTPIKLAKTLVTKTQLTKFSHLHEQIKFAIEHLLVCTGLWALQRHRQASQYTK